VTRRLHRRLYAGATHHDGSPVYAGLGNQFDGCTCPCQRMPNSQRHLDHRTILNQLCISAQNVANIVFAGDRSKGGVSVVGKITAEPNGPSNDA
jgi:hypothetical protein